MRQAYDYWQDQPGSYSSVAAARQERRGADLGPTQGRERVLTLKRLGTGAQSEASVDGLSHRTGPLSIIRHQRRWSEPSDGLAPCYPDPHPTHPPQGTDALPSLSNLNVLLVPGTVRNSAPAAAGPRRPIRQQAPSAKVNGTFERSLAAAAGPRRPIRQLPPPALGLILLALQYPVTIQDLRSAAGHPHGARTGHSKAGHDVRDPLAF